MSETPIVPGTPEASETEQEIVTNESQFENGAVVTEQENASPAAAAETLSDVQEPAVEMADQTPNAADAPVTSDAPVAETPATTPTSAPFPVGSKLDLTTPTIVGHVGSDEFAKAQEEAKRLREEEKERKEQERKVRDEVFAQLAALSEQGASFDITITERVKGGLRGTFNGLKVFLPASHFGLRKNVSEEELAAAVGTTTTVKVHELQSDETGYKSAVVSRRDIQMDEFWSGIVVGSVHEGVVSSVTAFGAFVNIGGAEGLVHISRLSKQRIQSAEEVVRKGEKIKVTVVEIDREKKKLSLSHKEHEADPWEGVGDLFPVGTIVKGIVRRMTDFGAYVQVAARIEGLLRISELTWTRRIKHPSDIISVGQEIEVAILDVNVAKHQLALGYKQTQPNPWMTAADTMPVGSTVSGVVQSSSAQGAVIRVNDIFDGFMPRSKMANAGPGRKVAVAEGEAIECVVVDVNPLTASLILAMKNDDGSAYSASSGGFAYGGEEGGNEGRGGHRGERGDRRNKGSRRHNNDDGEYGNFDASASAQSNVTLGDLLRDADKSNLNG